MTWLYLPSTSFLSAPEAADSTSEWNWQSQALAQFCTWRGKHSPSRTWLQRCVKVSWLTHLCGAMPSPSTADHGVASWMASLAASRVSRIPWPDAKVAGLMSATSGAMPDASSSSPAHGSSSSKTSAACLRRGLMKSLEPSGFGETYENWVSRLRVDCSLRQRSVPVIGANASSSSGLQELAWPTPVVTDSFGARNRTSGRSNPNSKHHDGVTLNDAIILYQGSARPTPTASMVTGLGSEGRDGGDNLQTAVTKFQASARPTPTASDWKGSGPTIERSDGKMRGDRLDYAAEQFWSTPSVADTEGGRKSRSGALLVERLMNGQAEDLAHSLQGQETERHGSRSANSLLNAYRRYRATTDSFLRSEMRSLLLMAIRRQGIGWTRDRRTAFVRPSFFVNFGSDPTIMSVVAVKKDQARGINDPGAEPAAIYTDESRIKMLAQSFLERDNS